jgi:hypothetical protein
MEKPESGVGQDEKNKEAYHDDGGWVVAVAAGS